MKKYLKILLMRNVMQFQSEIAYRVEVIFLLLNTIVLISATVILYTLIFSQTKVVGDWGYIPMLYLFAIGNIAISIYTMFAWGPIYHQFRPAVKTGMMDTFLLKPMSPRFLLLTGRFDMSGLARLIPSLVLLIYLISKFPLAATPLQLTLFLIYFVVGLVLLNATIFLLYTAAFWTTSTDYFHHPAWAFIGASSMPLSAFPKVVFWIASTLVPVGFAAVIPVRTLSGLDPVSPGTIFLSLVVLSIYLFVCDLAWNKGLQHYSGASA